MNNPKSKTQHSKFPDEATRRRHLFYGVCNELGLTYEDQRSIAEGIIPKRYPGRINKTGEISRKPLFENPRYFAKAMDHLNKLKAGRRKFHRRLDGSQSENKSGSQLSYIKSLARRLHWDEHGEDDLTYRLERFAARLTGSRSENAVRDLGTLTAKEASNIILALKNFKVKSHAAD